MSDQNPSRQSALAQLGDVCRLLEEFVDLSPQVLPIIGSTLMGVLYDVSIPGLIAFSVVAQLGALPVLWVVAKRSRGATDRP
jgi:hypothetical protein